MIPPNTSHGCWIIWSHVVGFWKSYVKTDGAWTSAVCGIPIAATVDLHLARRFYGASLPLGLSYGLMYTFMELTLRYKMLRRPTVYNQSHNPAVEANGLNIAAVRSVVDSFPCFQA